MFAHKTNSMLSLQHDLRLNPQDVKAFQHNWTQSIREVSRVARQKRWGILANF